MRKESRLSNEANCIQRRKDCHKGKDVFVCGTGTSLANFPWESLNDKITIALNDAIFVEGFTPTYHLFSDVNIWKRYAPMKWKDPCLMVCQRHGRRLFLNSKTCKFQNSIWQFDISHLPELEKLDQRLFVRRTVATGGINMAYKFGAKRIFLLGVDGYKYNHRYYHDGSIKPNESRRQTELPPDIPGKKKSIRVVQDRHQAWVKDMETLAKAFKDNNLYKGPYPEGGVYNLSPLSTIEAWPKIDPKEVLGFSW